jgi:hypothetical protein
MDAPPRQADFLACVLPKVPFIISLLARIVLVDGAPGFIRTTGSAPPGRFCNTEASQSSAHHNTCLAWTVIVDGARELVGMPSLLRPKCISL